MFGRLIIFEFEKWLAKPQRKPLVLRGARQVGKTTAVNQFAVKFSQYIYLNLELSADRAPFERFTDMDTLLQSLFFLKNKSLTQKADTLIFIE